MTKREKLLLTIFIVLVIFCVYFYFVRFITEDIADVKSENDALTLTYEETQIQIDAIESYEVALENNQEALELVKANIGAYYEDEDIHVVFTEMANSYGVTPITLSIAEDTEAYITTDVEDAQDYFVAKEVTLSFTTTSENFTQLVQDMNARGDMMILSVAQSASDGAYSDFEMDCVIFMEDEN